MQAPDEWKPELRDAWCGYAVDWIATKERWDLAVRDAERGALEIMLDLCTGAERIRIWPPVEAPISIAPPNPEPIPPEPPPTASVVISSCLPRSEIVTITNASTGLINLSGWRLHDEFDNHRISLPNFALTPSQ